MLSEGGRQRLAGARRTLALLAVLGVLSSCGGGGSDSDDGVTAPAAGVPDFQGDDVARLQPGDRPVRFRLDTSVSPETTRFVVESLQMAHTDLGDSGPLTVHVYGDERRFVAAYTEDFGISAEEAREELAGGLFAFASEGGHIWLYLPNYNDAPEGSRRETLFHEYEHTKQGWQAEVRFQSEEPRERSFIPRWLVEGCAEYVAVKAAWERGFVAEVEARADVLSGALESTEPLRTFETDGGADFVDGGEAGAYTVGWLACERLASVHGADSVLHAFWLSMADTRNWQQAFSAAFGVTPDEFYVDFERYRTTLDPVS